ncbi:hypothetical protein [Euzebya pacifica]|uniref:Ppx/GppA phosphatase family protein n=1 Tax=Euzebya pacifica TaxID=1608957 RepID=UPI0030F769FF
MTRLAALDLGSNSFHLLVADTRPRGRIKRVTTRKKTIRLGEPVSRTGRLGSEAFGRAVEAFTTLVELADDEGADKVIAVGTEALRVAEDGPEFLQQMKDRHGVPVQLLDGLDEAALSLKGMACALNLPPEQEVLGLDLGGGSLEVALGGTNGMVAGATFPLGGAKLVDRISDPPRLHERAALHAMAMELIQPAADKVLAARTTPDEPLVALATAGSIRDIARFGLALTSGSAPAKVRGMMVSREQMELAYSRLCSVDAHDRMDLPGISSKRADLLPAAGISVLAAMEAFGLQSITLCDWGLREGVLLDLGADGHIVDHDFVVDREDRRG